MAGRVIAYVTQGCPNSAQALQILREENVAFDVVNITEYPLGVDTVFVTIGDKSVPHVFVNQQHLGVCLWNTTTHFTKNANNHRGWMNLLNWKHKGNYKTEWMNYWLMTKRRLRQIVPLMRRRKRESSKKTCSLYQSLKRLNLSSTSNSMWCWTTFGNEPTFPKKRVA